MFEPLVDRISAGYDSQKSLEKDNNEVKIKTTHSSVWMVLAPSSWRTEEVLHVAGLPKVGSWEMGRKCKSSNASAQTMVTYQGEQARIWSVTLDYDSDYDNKEDPTELEPEISWSSETYEEVLEKDVITGKPIQTACGEPILATVARVMPIATIAYYKPENFSISASCIGCINSKAFMGWAAKTALLKSVSVSYEKKVVGGEEKRFAKITLTVIFKDNGQDEPWKLRVLHHGRKCKDPKTGEVVVWQDKQNGSCGTVNLNANGNALGPDDPPQFLEFNQYKIIDFSVLGL